LKPGSTAWLLAHEARIQWRGLSDTSRTVSASLLGVFTLVLAAAGWGISLMLDRAQVTLTRELVFGLFGATALVFSLMMSQTVSSAAQSFYARRDLDLLLSSPVPAAASWAPAAWALAASTGAIWLFLALPPTVTLAVLGHPRWLGAPLTLAALALLATTVGLWLAMALFAVLGPAAHPDRLPGSGRLHRRGFLPGVPGPQLGARAHPRGRLRAVQPGRRLARFRARLPLSWPARASHRRALPLLARAGVSALAFGATTAVLGRRFAENAAAAAGREAGRVKASTGDARAFSRGAMPATVKKELRLIARDPALMSQVLLRLLYMVPLLALMWRAGDDDRTAGLAGVAAAVAFMTAQLAGSLARITVTAEDAPDLLACAPVPPSLVRRGKLTAALLPVGVLLALPVAALVWVSPTAGGADADLLRGRGAVGRAGRALDGQALQAFGVQQAGRDRQHRRQHRRGGHLRALGGGGLSQRQLRELGTGAGDRRRPGPDPPAATGERLCLLRSCWWRPARWWTTTAAC
jgi:ABC-2 type transport system permease protein